MLEQKSILTTYFNSLKKFPQLSHEECIDLFNKFNQGDTKAKNKLIEWRSVVR